MGLSVLTVLFPAMTREDKPSIDFYLGIGARPMSDWTVYRIDGERLEAMVADARR